MECLQWMVEEYKVPLEVRDTGGETLMHHAAYNGKVKPQDISSRLNCFEYQHCRLHLVCGSNDIHEMCHSHTRGCLFLLYSVCIN